MVFGIGRLGSGFGGMGRIGGSSPHILWTPLNDAGLIDWWSTTATASFTFNGSNVAAWIGQKATVNMVQATGANQPAYTGSTIGGVQSLTFNGASSQNLLSPNFSQPGTWTLATVGQLTSTAGTQNFVDSDDGTTNRQSQYLRNNVGALESIAFNTVPANFTASVSPLTTAAAIVGSQHAATTILATINGTDGTPTTTTGTPATVNTGLTFGRNLAGGNALTGNLGDVIFTNTVSTSVKQKMEGFLAWKFGLQGNLPGGHPYKSRAPFVSDP